MVTLLLHGSYTPAVWSIIRANPDSAPRKIERIAGFARCRMLHFYFALDNFDFYAVIEGPDLNHVSAMRHALMASGSYTLLCGEPIFTSPEILPLVQETLASSMHDSRGGGPNVD